MTLDDNTLQERIHELEKEIMDKKQALAKLRKDLIPQEIKDYTLIDKDGKEVQLSELFGDSNEMLLVFNMGKTCRWCTLWADGYNGISQHLQSRAAFIVVSPDPPEVQQEFADTREWDFPMLSYQGSDIGKDLGYQTEDGYYMPGVISLSKSKEGKICYHSKAFFGPSDNYCVQYDFMDLLPKGAKNWQPQYEYSTEISNN
ncbi:MAG: DUF899 family protein [Chitinophagales bacterium]